MGGEKGFQMAQVQLKLGSPPHGRGKGSLCFCILVCFGITPAWAGKSLVCYTSGMKKQDHPRMGGEKHGAPASLMWSAGSPPHGRGKVYLGPQLGAGYGITPAWAGKSAQPSGPGRYAQDHPRMGGEK